MKTSQSIFPVLCVAVAVSLTALTSQAQIVTNGGFEVGTSTTAPPWTFTDSSNFTGFGSDAAFAHSGSRYAFLGARGTIGSLSQTINTTLGVKQNLSFWLANDLAPGRTPSNFFQALFNGVSIFTLAPDAAPFDYTQFFASFMGTGAPGILEFRYRNDPDFFRLDDVAVGVPDSGSTAWLALPAFGVLLLVQSRLRRA